MQDRVGPRAGSARHRAARALVAATLLAVSSADAASALSDRVVVLEADARSHTVQHTLFSDGPLVALRLPGSVIPQRVVFGGPERQIFGDAYRARAERIALWSGSAFARYRHQYGDAVSRRADGAWRLIAASVSPELSIDLDPIDGRAPDIDITSTWVFPADAEVLSWTADDAAAGDWTFEANTLVWTQAHARPVTLTVDYRLDEPATGEVDGAGTTIADQAPPAPPARDYDADGVPDERDVCLGEALPSAVADGPPQLVGDPPIDYALPGCGGVEAVILSGVGFPTGQSYLDLPARRALDRVANALVAALAEAPGGLREVAAFTDSDGSRANNLALSARRARAVRQYLLLRGVAPGHLHANGYGEAEPIADNGTADGRRRNRRVELRPFRSAEDDR